MRKHLGAAGKGLSVLERPPTLRCEPGKSCHSRAQNLFAEYGTRPILIQEDDPPIEERRHARASEAGPEGSADPYSHCQEASLPVEGLIEL